MESTPNVNKIDEFNIFNVLNLKGLMVYIKA